MHTTLGLPPSDSARNHLMPSVAIPLATPSACIAPRRAEDASVRG